MRKLMSELGSSGPGCMLPPPSMCHIHAGSLYNDVKHCRTHTLKHRGTQQGEVTCSTAPAAYQKAPEMPYVNTSLDDCRSVDDHVLNRHCSLSIKHSSLQDPHMFCCEHEHLNYRSACFTEIAMHFCTGPHAPSMLSARHERRHPCRLDGERP